MYSKDQMIKWKANSEKICDFSIEQGNSLLSPIEDPITGTLYLISSTGELFTFNEGSSDSHSVFNLEPSCICFDSNGFFYLADYSSSALLYKSSINEINTTVDQVLIKDYDNKPFQGITSFAYNHNENIIYFTDAGKLEVSALYPAVGSVFMLDLDTKVIKPLMYECLSYPVDIVYDYINKTIYVAEMLANRIIRIKQDNAGIFYSSVFFQFSGRIGPRALSIDELGNLYCARYETQDNSGTIDINNSLDGLITVLDSSGIIKGEITIPKSPEIISILIPSRKKDSLFYTLNENKTIYKIKLSVFISELEALEINQQKALQFNSN